MSSDAEPALEERRRPTSQHRPAHSRDSAVHSGRRVLSRWAAPAAVLIAVIALAVGVWALLRPAPANNPAPPTARQIADAKGHACAAYTTVRTAVLLQTHADPGTNPVSAQAVAANARLAMAGGGSYLLGHLDPATPPQLAESIRSFAVDLQDLAINALAGAGNDDPGQLARLHDGDAASAKIAQLCK
jgi:hypothetical protein